MEHLSSLVNSQSFSPSLNIYDGIINKSNHFISRTAQTICDDRTGLSRWKPRGRACRAPVSHLSRVGVVIRNWLLKEFV